MKKAIVTVFCAAALMACKKNESTATTSSTDSTMNMPMNDSGMMTTDSATVSGTTGTGMLSDQDKTFADAAAMGGMMEVMAGQAAEAQGTNEKIKALGKMMVTDHTKANDELKSWAASAGHTLPMALDADKQKKIDDLKAKKGADFDKAYADMMVMDHKTTIDLFKKQAANGSDEALKSFATKTLPTLEHHLTASQEAKDIVK